MLWWWSLAFLSLVLLSSNVRGDGECTPQGPFCQDGFCCSKAGYCGQTDAYCAPGNCQSQCPTPSPPPPPPPPPGPPPPPPAPGGVADFVTPELFEELLPYRNDPRCHAVGFYTYDAFIQAAEYFPEFGRTGDNATRKREIAAFLGQTSQETTGGWEGADGGRFAWGYCYKEEQDDRSAHCSPSTNYPCAAGKYYFGRGPIQLSWNYNYGPCGEAIGLGLNLLNTPELVSSDPLVAFKTAIWFWMTPQAPKPSCHDVMVGAWTPSPSDVAAGRVAGYGLTTNIINGGYECKGGVNQDRNVYRIGFYERYCEKLGTETGDNLDCYNQEPYGNGLLNSFNPIIEEVVSVI